ncbi:hypothetical protein RLO149_c001190 [Roseobacter litoralis Och 149]|uniref:Uncharacterized protein n=1 Tax=Roseobacter litoralis (strain ATCC 49566 / DSM 6996 / JCM 21268 / NBRC 15278 / OCh 149) TaxID=391595 RepID=F7ZES0_ROSLO|nr:hypothetical protein RLO149_c001190 [Roseobacter litoralis Och 149]
MRTYPVFSDRANRHALACDQASQGWTWRGSKVPMSVASVRWYIYCCGCKKGGPCKPPFKRTTPALDRLVKLFASVLDVLANALGGFAGCQRRDCDNECYNSKHDVFLLSV